ncbi:LysR substrate-binding domain-containing protein [Pacificibacter marinus]|uniref:LysR substrate-binding domain-containing protein n=1 Tax=Pacificibacter marinus TaxID=658057 RepID=UPI001C07B715|nr:LysR substrate-binding domain-containing protein [Pacificibacter marinus]MBU2867332.1 LysR family transcriptional regulator [Pacificibacter marinus]
MRYSLAQIQAIVEVSRCGFHVSKAAARLHSSQSVISKHLKSFEDNFSAKVFRRTGKRLVGLTPEGEKVLQFAERIIRDHDSIDKIGREMSTTERENLSLVTTPTLARYLLADTVKKFIQSHSQVELNILVEESDKAVDILKQGRCDLAIVPTGKIPMSELDVTPLTEWSRSLIGLPDCPLFDGRKLTLENIASEPLIAFQTPMISLQDTFDQKGLATNTTLTTSNPEVMKAYAELGLGVAIIATPTFHPVRDAPLVLRDVSDIFPPVRIAALRLKDTYRIAMQTKFVEYLKASF